MSKIKAKVYTVLLAITIFVLLFTATRVESENGVNLFNCITSCVAGIWTADKLINFYKWLRKDRHQD